MAKSLLPGAKKPSAESTFTPQSVIDKYHGALRQTLDERRNFTLNHAYLLGKQWLWWNNSDKRIEEMPKSGDRIQATFDRLLGNTNTIMAKALQKDLHFDVNPTAADDATILGARTAAAVLEATRMQHDWEHLREQNLRAAWEGGSSAIAVEWDPTAGRNIGDNLYEGDTIETVLNITEFVVEPGTRHAERSRYWIKAQAIPPFEVQARYHMEDAPAADATASMSPFNQRLMETELVPLTLVLTYYERPNDLCPAGRVAVVVDNKFVEGPKAWPFPFKDHLNIALVRETPIEGKWLGMTKLSIARPVQAMLNAAMSNVIEHLKLVGNARMVIPQSSADLVNELDDIPGAPVFYSDGGTQPNYMSPPQMPSWINELPATLMAQIDDITGVHAISRGATPMNAPDSGYGLSILAEQEDTPIGRLIKETAIAWSKVGTMELQIFEANVSESRKAVVVRTPSAPPQTIKWTGKDLMGQTQAEIPTDAIMPRSRAAMQQFAEKMLQMGMIQSLPQLATIAELPGASDIIQAVQPDVSKAQRENHAFAEGRALLVATFDDDDIHIKQHTDFAKSPRYEAMSRPDQTNFLNHIKAHEVSAAHKAANAVARGNIAPALAGAPRADGGPVLPPNNLPADPGMQLPALPPGEGPAAPPQLPQ